MLAALEVGNAVLLLSGLSFLGLGAQPPEPEWGAMVSDGARNFDRWWLGVFPGLAILTVVMAFNFLGDTLRDAAGPADRSRAAGHAVTAAAVAPVAPPVVRAEGLRVLLPGRDGTSIGRGRRC